MVEKKTSATVKKRLGDMLISAGHITEEQLDLALREQQRTGALLGEILCNLGLVTHEVVSSALAESAGVEYVQLKECRFSAELMKAVPEAFARRHRLVPIALENGVLKVAMANIFDITTVDDLERLTKYYVEIKAATEDDIMAAIDRCYGTKEGEAQEIVVEQEGKPIEDIIEESIKQAEKQADTGEATEIAMVAPVIKLVDLLLTYAVKQEATDLHIEPEENLIRTRYRIDGILHQGPSLPKKLLSPLTVRVKIMSGMNISENRLPQDGRIKFTTDNKVIDMRVSSYPTTFGETMALRLLDKDKLVRGLESLGFNLSNLEIFKQVVAKHNGIILATGPTGSGKTTTLYSTLSYLNNLERKIITVEDPVEYELPIIRQSQINPKAGLTFAVGLRSILRQDPDVIFVGEIRDSETAEMAVRAALTGHLVFSTLHTNDAVGAVPRLIDMGVEPFLVASSVAAVIAQRLARKVCSQCKEEVPANPALLAQLSPEEKARITKFFMGKGCSNCRHTGYKGRIGIFELLNITPELSELIMRRANINVLKSQALKLGFRTLRDDALEKVTQGITTLEEILKAV
ncbi:MAG: ATPase, T2SS/T4P/T4SS family [Candidatus Brocadiales bacterium]|nr:ATPase, T2SS/T4P/T4SS family [Candidatus Brocadiales bacterium]